MRMDSSRVPTNVLKDEFQKMRKFLKMRNSLKMSSKLPKFHKNSLDLAENSV